MADLRAAILDIDGTLVDSNYEHVQAWYQAFRAADLTVPEFSIHRSVGMGSDKLIPHLLALSEEDPRLKPLGEAHSRIFKEQYLQGIQPLPSVTDFFDRLKGAGFRIALGTSATQDELDHYVDLLSIRSYLDAVVTANDVSQTKPEPEIGHLACQKLEVTPSQAIFVGDSVWDGESARRAGMPFVGLMTGGFGEDELRQVGALQVYRDLPTLLYEWDRSPFA